jgi:response regulator of citrate/malate metabolism
MTTVLVVDDDYRIADLHSSLVAQVSGYRVVGTVHSAAAAGESVRKHRPDLLLLDLYLPDGAGLDLLKQLRAEGMPVDAIVLTAADDIDRVREALRLGALHYLVKPFSLVRLREHLVRYQRLQRHLQAGSASQAVVDQAYELIRAGAEEPEPPSTGTSNPTVATIREALQNLGDWVSASDVADQVGISLSTARRYLSRLVESGKVEMSLRYGTAGRPVHLYRRRPRHGSAG